MSVDPTQFEEPILRLRREIEEVTAAEGDPGQLAELQQQLTKVARDIYANLTPWQKTLVARHPQRPYTLDFIALLFEEWTEIHGDRKFADDPAVVAGFARFRGHACAVVGHQKGRNTKEKVIRNFGQPRPEGFRKALRVIQYRGAGRTETARYVSDPASTSSTLFAEFGHERNGVFF